MLAAKKVPRSAVDEPGLQAQLLLAPTLTLTLTLAFTLTLPLSCSKP